MEGMAITITPDGIVSTVRFANLAESGRPAERYLHLCELLDARGTAEITLPQAGGLVVWVDRSEACTRQSLNLTASIAIVKILGVAMPAIHGPVIITGGWVDEPQALSDRQVAEALELLDLEAHIEGSI